MSRQGSKPLRALTWPICGKNQFTEDEGKGYAAGLLSFISFNLSEHVHVVMITNLICDILWCYHILFAYVLLNLLIVLRKD
jgi:hypothetical protein